MKNAELNRLIQKMHPLASVTAQALPDCPDIALWLVEPESMNRAFSQEEVDQIQAYPAYWAFCWASGQVLAQAVLSHPEWVAGKRVIDFGAGSGVVAIACAMAGADRVIACDIDHDALHACQRNAELNGVELEVHDDLFTMNSETDLLIAADVLYDRANLSFLEVFREKAPEVLIADSRIRNFDYPPYKTVSVHSSHTVPDLDESDEFRHVTLYHTGISPLSP